MSTPSRTEWEYRASILKIESRAFVHGEYGPAASGETFDCISPIDGRPLARVASCAAADAERAVLDARTAFESGVWSRLAPARRKAVLQRFAGLLEAHNEELALLETLDMGKPIGDALSVDVPAAVRAIRWSAEAIDKLYDEVAPTPHDQLGLVTREPVGVVAAIVPWNFPLLMAAWKLAPALAAGCTMVLKPAEETPLSALRLAELVLEAGYPAGVLNVVTGLGHTAGAALASHKGIEKVAFTGSTEVGKLVGKAALDNMTRVSLELGGKSPVIVLDDADPAQAAAGAAQAIFFNQGQVCTAGSRLFVHRSRFDQVVEQLAGIADAMKIGPGIDPSTQIGPLVSNIQRQRVMGYIESGLGEGARAAAGGSAGEGLGYFVKPTVLVNARDDMRVVREEIFGPVVVAMPYEDLDEVARRANDTPYGLAASIWSNDLSRVHRLIPKIKAGTVWVNCHNILDNAMPFGGYKQSGIGREMGRAVLDMYTESKSVVMML